MDKIVIAIDGLSACGKSTLAKDLAKRLDYIYVDSGAMYRAVTLYSIEQNISLEELPSKLQEINITFEVKNDSQAVLLNGKDVTLDIRSKGVNELVSPVAAISEVRSFLVAQQKQYGKQKAIVMDGRDIGTVVFPDAEMKFFISADLDVRTDRRTSELAEIGKTMSREEIQANLKTRDHIDSTRADSPLKKAEDAVEIDNSDLTKVEQLELCLKYVGARKKDGATEG